MAATVMTILHSRYIIPNMLQFTWNILYTPMHVCTMQIKKYITVTIDKAKPKIVMSVLQALNYY